MPLTHRAASPAAPVSLSVRLAQSGILAAAAGVFARKGAAATRVEDLLEAAGVARRTFYKYFGSKEAVLCALYELATTELLRAVQGAGDASDPLPTIRAGIDLYLDYHAENAALLKVIIEYSIRSDSPLAPLRRRFREQLVEILENAARAGSRHRHDRFTYVALISALEGLSLVLLEDGGKPAEIARAKAAMHDLVERVLGAAAHR